MIEFSLKSKIWQIAVLPIVDFIALVIGAVLVYLVRYKWYEGSFLGTKQIPSREYLIIVMILSGITIVLYVLLGVYSVNTKQHLLNLIIKLTCGIFIVLLSVITYLFFNEYNYSALPQGVPISRFILAMGGFFSLYSIVSARIGLWLFWQFLLLNGVGKINVLVVGNTNNEVVSWLQARREIRDIYQFHSLDSDQMSKVCDLIQSKQVSEIYLLDKIDKSEHTIANLAERNKIQLFFSPSSFSDNNFFGIKPMIIGNKVLLEIKYTNLDGWWIVLKRMFDIIVSLSAIVLLSPVFIIIAIAIYIDSPGPILYRSDRVGSNGNHFKLFKFRRFKPEFNTSETDPDAKKALEYEAELIRNNNLKKDNVLYKIKDDPRRTRVGIFLEKYSLDELPQLFNVLIGTMSLVGPRPHQPREVQKYSSHHYKVLNIKPGITGLAQTNGRSDISFEEEVNFDTYYVEKWSLLLDLIILIKTPFIVLMPRHKS